MKKRILIVIIALFLVILLVGCKKTTTTTTKRTTTTTKPLVIDNVVEETKLETYDGPNAMETSKVMDVKVEGHDLFVYDTRVNHDRSFTYLTKNTLNQVVIFDFIGEVKIDVTINDATSLFNVCVRPSAYGIEPSVNGNKISFTLSHYGNYTLEYGLTEEDTASDNVLHVFANPIEEESDKYDPSDENTLYVGPGIWMANALPIDRDNMTVYLAGGAILYGQLKAGDLKGLTIKGRGIISGSLFERNTASQFKLPIELQRCEDVTIKDITILDPAGWAVTLYKCKNVNVENLKIITARANGDGISVQSCENVNVSKGFVRTWDDSLVVKNVDQTSTKGVHFDGVTVWTDLAQSMEVGFETYGDTMDDISFKNITVLHNFHKPAMSIHNADNAKITNVRYENITIEEAMMKGDNQLDGLDDYLIDMTIAFNTEWTKSEGIRGSIKNVTINNVKVLKMADSIICRMFGEGVNSNIDNVSISNIEIEGKRINSLEELKLTPGAYTSNVTYNLNSSVTGARIIPDYLLDLKTTEINYKNNLNINQDGLEIPSFAILNNEPSYAGKKNDVSDANKLLTLGVGDKAASEWNVKEAISVESKGIENLFDGDRTTEWEFNGWDEVDKEFVALTLEFDERVNIGNIRILGSTNEKYMKYYSMGIFVKNELDGKWSRIQAQADFELDPQKSNYTDILTRISANGGYYGIQLRFFRNDNITHPETIKIGEIEFYPPSYTTGKSVLDASKYEDVYDSGYILDGNPLSYFESAKGVWPAFFTVDMGADVMVKYINICLVPSLNWSTRTQNIEILGSNDNVNFTTIIEATDYVFDPELGNMLLITLDSPVNMRYIKLVYNSNTSGYGAQISELYVYSE